jgi:hypothetical protein
MATFLNPKTRKMKHLSSMQKEECIESIKQEMLLFDVDDRVKSPKPRKESRLQTNNSIKYMTDFYLNAEDDDEDYIDQNTSLRSSSHALEIEFYMKQGSDKSTKTPDSPGEKEEEEYNPLSFWKKMHSSYPILSKVAARVFGVPASSAAVEREFSLAGNIITQKRSKLSPDAVNDMVFNHSYKMYKEKFDHTNEGELHE